MKKNFLLILVVLIAVTSKAQTDNSIVIGKYDSVYSTILKEKRKVAVYVPNMTTGAQLTNQRYPVVYLLDGEGHFQSVVGLIQ